MVYPILKKNILESWWNGRYKTKHCDKENSVRRHKTQRTCKGCVPLPGGCLCHHQIVDRQEGGYLKYNNQQDIYLCTSLNWFSLNERYWHVLIFIQAALLHRIDFPLQHNQNNKIFTFVILLLYCRKSSIRPQFSLLTLENNVCIAKVITPEWENHLLQSRQDHFTNVVWYLTVCCQKYTLICFVCIMHHGYTFLGAGSSIWIILSAVSMYCNSVAD